MVSGMGRETEQQKREKALMAAMARGKVLKSLPRDIDVANRLNIPHCTFERHKKDAFQRLDLYKFGLMARTLGFTGREVCDIVGVPYDQGRGA